MLNRKVRGMITYLQEKLEKPETLEIAMRRNQRRQTVKKSHDKKSHKPNNLEVDQAVYVYQIKGHNWKIGEIRDILGPRTYIVKYQNGSPYCKHRVHVRPTKVNF